MSEWLQYYSTEVVVYLNVILNNDVLLLISIYICNLRCQIASVAFNLDVLIFLSMTLKIRPKQCMHGSCRRVVGNILFLSIPTPKSVVHTILNAAMCSFWPRVGETIDESSVEHQQQQA